MLAQTNTIGSKMQEWQKQTIELGKLLSDLGAIETDTIMPPKTARTTPENGHITVPVGESVLRVIAEHPHATATEIGVFLLARGINVAPIAVQGALQRLRASKKIRARGPKGQMKYSVV